MHSCGVTQPMQARGAPTVGFATDSSGLKQSFKRMIDVVFSHLCSISACKKGGLHPFRQRTMRTSFGISPHGIGELRGYGDETTLVEFGIPYRQHFARKV